VFASSVRGRCNQRCVLATDVIRYARPGAQAEEGDLKKARIIKARKKKTPRSSAKFSTLDDFLKGEKASSKNFNQSPSRKFWLGRPPGR
jgi:hypothetical protein